MKGAGCDCGYLLIRCFEASGLIQECHPDPYPPDWHLHREEERYLNLVLEYCAPVPSPLPGDLALYRFGRAISHGAIVVQWPLVVHAVMGQGVILSDVSQPSWADRFSGHYRLKEA